jgi:hypothetical protein
MQQQIKNHKTRRELRLSCPGANTRLGGGGWLPGYSPPSKPQKVNLKNTDFVETLVSDVSRDLPFSRNLPLKSADD